MQFGVDGRNFEVDLSDDNAERLREVLRPFIEAGRRLVPPGKRRRRKQKHEDGPGVGSTMMGESNDTRQP
ncbi:Lsr2 dimerization domain-containing protein [Plantibacter flavus]|uniref:Lsr2 dimerization domain-containing protein n=1 Tax=Plantibacter flavus TaxID=150123 RepID=UPI001B866F55